MKYKKITTGRNKTILLAVLVSTLVIIYYLSWQTIGTNNYYEFRKFLPSSIKAILKQTVYVPILLTEQRHLLTEQKQWKNKYEELIRETKKLKTKYRLAIPEHENLKERYTNLEANYRNLAILVPSLNHTGPRIDFQDEPFGATPKPNKKVHKEWNLKLRQKFDLWWVDEHLLTEQRQLSPPEIAAQLNHIKKQKENVILRFFANKLMPAYRNIAGEGRYYNFDRQKAPCPKSANVILVTGQSNAANHLKSIKYENNNTCRRSGNAIGSNHGNDP